MDKHLESAIAKAELVAPEAVSAMAVGYTAAIHALLEKHGVDSSDELPSPLSDFIGSAIDYASAYVIEVL